MSTSDHLSLSSCTVICLWDKYYAEFSTVEPVAFFLSLLMMVLTICVRLFLIQTSCSRSHLHTEQSRASRTDDCVVDGKLNPVTNSMMQKSTYESVIL